MMVFPSISHYRILNKLGAGGMGEVYLAEDTRLDRKVAIKLLPADFAADHDRARRFEQEARATSALNHPNILTVYDIGSHNGSPFIVAELLEGLELRERLNEGAIPQRKAIEYAQQIVAGLSAAHERGITHRDLKPENLFITTDDPHCRVNLRGARVRLRACLAIHDDLANGVARGRRRHRDWRIVRMHMLRRLLVTVLLIIPAVSAAQRGDVSGVTFIDVNGNGVRDSGERGLANVAVSNQDAVVATDASGVYRLPRGANGLLFVSVPDGYRTVGAFWRLVDDMTSTVDFPLSPITRSTEFTFIHASDTHIAPAVMARTRRFRALVDSLNPAFVIITGDLVKDALRVGETEATGYYELFRREVALFKSTVWTVPGNHENFGIERGQSKVSTAHPLYGRKMYYHYRGPDYYSFTFGGVHFVGLNTVDIDDQWYYGHVDSLQLAWLERDLAMVPPMMPVVTFNHIPFFSSFDGLSGYTDEPPAPTLITVKGKTAFRHTVSNAGAVLAVLRKHRHVLALGGHVHAGEHIVYEVDGLKTRFNQTPAIVGPGAGAGMQFVSGFTFYTVRNGVIDPGRFIPLGIDAEK